MLVEAGVRDNVAALCGAGRSMSTRYDPHLSLAARVDIAHRWRFGRESSGERKACTSKPNGVLRAILMPLVSLRTRCRRPRPYARAARASTETPCSRDWRSLSAGRNG
jgi:hypothetical protein